MGDQATSLFLSQKTLVKQAPSSLRKDARSALY